MGVKVSDRHRVMKFLGISSGSSAGLEQPGQGDHRRQTLCVTLKSFPSESSKDVAAHRFQEVSQAKNRKEKWSVGWLRLILKKNACRVLGLRQGSAEEETTAGTACVEGRTVSPGPRQSGCLHVSLAGYFLSMEVLSFHGTIIKIYFPLGLSFVWWDRGPVLAAGNLDAHS